MSDAERIISRLQNAHTLSKLVGESPTFVRATSQIERVARAAGTVLITGETGTGKELIARIIHYGGRTAEFPFVAVNCGALPDTLFEGELFGHEPGAFTDARSRQAGLISHAENGTLFLDEIDTLSRRGQVALLRVLQDKTYRPLGSGVERHATVRFVAASNMDISRMILDGSFRADLYYRLSVFSVSLPPLRERREDVLPLARHFVRKHSPTGRPAPELSATACAALVAYDWPGNARELENAIIRGVQLCLTDKIEVQDLGLPTAPGNTETPSLGSSFTVLKRKAIATFEIGYLTQLMQEHQGNVTKAAQAAGKERREFGKLLKKYQLNASSGRESKVG